MMLRSRGSLVVTAVVVGACSSGAAHPGILQDPSPGVIGVSGGTSSGDGGSTGGGGMAPACNGVFDVGRVYFHGLVNLQYGGVGVVADPSFPAAPCGMLDLTVNPSLRGDGSVVYINPKTNRIHVMVSDALSATTDPAANDSPLTSDKCSATGDAIRYLVTHPATTDVYYACSSNPKRVYDTSGNVFSDATNLWAVGADGSKLVNDSDLGLSPNIVTTSGTKVPVTLPVNSDDVALTFRYHGGGFWAATASSSTGTYHLYFIGSDGQTTVVGQYPNPPANISPGKFPVLDASGTLFQKGTDTTSTANVIFARPLNGQSTTTVYSDANAPKITNGSPIYTVGYSNLNLATGP